ncbi:MAG: bacillithiol biosynthesis BshC, partial [Brumimicrobium sp.]|nr:bacillithiol biosynthesis BshC [Brumimicrobium sp.]
MRVEKTDRRKTSFFSGIANDLVYDQHALNEFLNNSFIEENLIKQAAEKKSSYSSEFREKLKEVLLAQHKSYLHYEKIDRHLQELSNDKTFTVTTGHQLSLYGGPQYVVYKIIHAIRLSEELNKKQSEYKFIPVFWLASEDHDFEEINHIHLFNDTLVWESAQKGPVGRFNLRDIDEFRNQVLHKFENNPSFSAYLNNFYRNDELSFSEATRKFLLDLFGERG